MDDKQLHVKPSSIELENSIQSTLKDLEQVDLTAPPIEEDEVVVPPIEEDEVVVPPIKVEPKTEEPTEEETFKKRYADSTREAQILAAKNKKLNEALEKVTSLPEPEEEQLKLEAFKQGLTYEEMSDVEKTLFKKSIHNDLKLSAIAEVSRENKDVEKWNEEVDTFVEDPKTFIKFPDLEGKNDDFRIFATKNTRRNVDFPTLVSSFLYEVDKSRIKHKGEMFPSGSGGPNETDKPKSDKISMEQAILLMKTNYKEYKRLVLADKIDTSNLT